MLVQTFVNQLCVDGAEIYLFSAIDILKSELQYLEKRLELSHCEQEECATLKNEITLIQTQLKQLIDSTTRFGVTSPQFDQWFTWWQTYAYQEISDACLKEIDDILNNSNPYDSESLLPCRPSGDWRNLGGTNVYKIG